MGTVLDSHFLALTALVTVSESLAPPPLPSFAVSAVYLSSVVPFWCSRGGGG
jgi:hypothetical protein